MDTDQKAKLPAMPADIGFGVGFFCGAVLAGFGVYLITTPEGKRLKNEIEAEFIKHRQAHDMIAIEATLLENSPATPFFKNTLRQIKELLHNPEIKAHPKTTPVPQKKKKYFKKKDE